MHVIKTRRGTSPIRPTYHSPMLVADAPTRPLHSFRNDATLLASLSCILVAIHIAVGNGYGFHRDELQFLDSSRHLSWGYVAYPPMTAFMGRLGIALFGISVQAYRLPAMFAAMLSLILTGLTARELGGRRPAQMIAFFIALASQVILASLMLYVVWDFLAWTLVCFFLARLLRTGDARWWLAVGTSFGMGILSKYSIAFLVAPILAGVLFLPSQRGHLREPWLYLGAFIALVVAAPNLLWEARHDWVTLKMLSTIHARDIRLGRNQGFLMDQLKFTMLGSLVALAGLVALLRSRQYRLLAFFYLGPLVLFLLGKGRGYYLLPAYTPLYAAGAVWIESKFATRTATFRRMTVGTIVVLGLAGAVIISVMMLPISHPGTALFAFQMRTSSDMRDETGWPELVEQVAHVHDGLPTTDRNHLGIIAGNYGEAGALALYGPARGLPQPISVVNSFYYRGYPSPPPRTLIVIGEDPKNVAPLFGSCVTAAYLTTQHHVSRSDNEDGPILICRDPKFDWAQLWATHQRFG